jgi:histidinol-phosphatase
MPIVTEAGGTFTAVTGEADVWHGSALATNGTLHERVLAAFAR